MKSYLITHLILYAVALFTTKRERDPYSNFDLGLLAIGHMAFGAWTIYLLCKVVP